MKTIHEHLDTALREEREQGYNTGFAAAEQALVWLQTIQPRTEKLNEVTRLFENRMERLRRK